ncbi:hypothetical protein ACF08M_11690 [Streptomyces sp. NPDC015032]|uniref:hypothetical protein n=1 Tax=Streptomyces sp. NPDC015032 TaxID=3364937 RepID=UPI0036F7A74D
MGQVGERIGFAISPANPGHTLRPHADRPAATAALAYVNAQVRIATSAGCLTMRAWLRSVLRTVATRFGPWQADVDGRAQLIESLAEASNGPEPTRIPAGMDQNYWARRIVHNTQAELQARHPGLPVIGSLVADDAEHALLALPQLDPRHHSQRLGRRPAASRGRRRRPAAGQPNEKRSDRPRPPRSDPTQ